jgi:predicted MPP superfamily phosphohydrolase
MNKKIGIVFIALIIIAIWLHWGNTSIQSTYINIHSEKIPDNFNGFTIVQVSDLHNASFGNRQADLLEDIKSASPDIIAVTGDLIDSNRTDLAKAMEFINGAIKIAPVYYVTGNHEARSHRYGELRRQMIEAGVTILDDESIPVKRDTDVIHLLGVNDPNVADPDNMTGIVWCLFKK